MSPITIRLRELRQERGLTQEELADLTGMDQPAISRIERGETQGMEYQVLERLCDALRCEPSDLLHYQPRHRRRR